MRKCILATLVVFISAFGSALAAESAIDDKKTGVIERLRYEIEHPGADTTPKSKSGASPMPDVWCGDIADEDTRSMCWKAYRAEFSYYESGLRHRTAVFDWAHLSTKIIFFVVNVLVGMGVYFSWVQFRQGRGVARGDLVAPEQHEIEVSTAGIKVKSSVLGVVVLALSMGFFYLYLRYVFPISEIF